MAYVGRLPPMSLLTWQNWIGKLEFYQRRTQFIDRFRILGKFKIIQTYMIFWLLLCYQAAVFGDSSIRTSRSKTAPSNAYSVVSNDVIHFDNKKLGDVLESLSSEYGFEYQIADALLEHDVSGSFQRRPLMGLLKRILAGVGYVVETGEAGQVKMVIVSRQSNDAGQSTDANKILPVPELDPILDEPVTSNNMTDEQLRGFEIADEQQTVPPEWMNDFEPEQEPGSEVTGPKPGF